MADYDDRDAAAYIAQRTGEPLQIVQEFLQKHISYQSSKYGNVIDMHSDVPGQERDRHEVFVEAVEMSEDDLTMELACLQMQWHNDSRFDEASIARLIAEEISYLASIGVVPPEVCPCVSAWAAWVASL